MADRNENLVAERVNRTAMTWLHQYDETFEPPQQNVLGVRVVGAGLHHVIAFERHGAKRPEVLAAARARLAELLGGAS